MKYIIGKYELSTVPRSLMRNYGELNHGGEGKSILINSLSSLYWIKNTTNTTTYYDRCYILIDVMQIVQKIRKHETVRSFDCPFFTVALMK